MKRISGSLLLLAALLSFITWGLIAEAGEIISAPHGFWIASKEKKGQLYGPTSEAADWNVSQWYAPRGELEGFKGGIAKGPSQSVRLLDEGAYEIESDGNGLACGQEYGAFAAANNPRVYKKYPSAFKESAPLSKMRTLKHRIALTSLTEVVRDRDCKVTRGVIITSVVLRNTHSSSTFFYQLRLRKVNRTPKPHWWRKGEGKGKGKSYGFGDNLATFGLDDVPLNKRTVVEVDLLPRLKELLRDSRVDIDRDPSHWVVSSTYHGQGIYGNIRIITRWDSFYLAYE